MDMLAAQQMATLVYHLPWPGIGHLAKRGDGFHYVPEPMQLARSSRRSDGRGRVVPARRRAASID